MNEDMIEYFAYGSNLNLNQMEERGTKVHSTEKAELPGWKLAFTYHSENKDGGVLDIIPGDEDDVVQGVVYHLDIQSLRKLDQFEGRDVRDNREIGAYRRQFIPVKLENNCKTVLTYVVNRTPEYKREVYFPPSDDYIDTVIQGAKDHDLSQDYLHRLKNLYSSERER